MIIINYLLFLLLLNMKLCIITQMFNLYCHYVIHSVFCPGLKKGMVLLEEKGHFCSRNYILRALSCAKLHFKGTFARKIIL